MPTIQLANVEPTQYAPYPVDMKEFLGRQKVVNQNEGTVLMNTAPEFPVRAEFSHSFLGAAYQAYSHHYNLVLRPDDVWLSIVLTFAHYVDKHAEAMRKTFVEHEGQKELRVTAGGTLTTASWDIIIRQFSDQIAANTKSEVRAWLEPSFSTTTAKDRLIGSVALMGAMKHYFAYSCGLCCGLPSVTMEGTLDDWLNVRSRADKLLEYGRDQPDLTKWHAILTPILDQFIQTYQNNPDRDFWAKICSYQGGSGVSYLSGWLLAFVTLR